MFQYSIIPAGGFCHCLIPADGFCYRLIPSSIIPPFQPQPLLEIPESRFPQVHDRAFMPQDGIGDLSHTDQMISGFVPRADAASDGDGGITE